MHRITSLRRRHSLALAALLSVGAFGPGAAFAQSPDPAKDYPSKVITLVVPYAAGGSSDTRARQVAEKIGAYLGKTVVVDNKPGAGGNIGTEFIARAVPDGYTIGIGNFAPLTVNKLLFPKLGYDALKDLTPVILLERGPLVLVVSAEKSVHKSFRDFQTYAKGNSGKVTYASAGTGGSFHLAGELLEDALGAKMIHVPYKGGGPATNDLIAGTVDFMFDMLPAASGYLKSNPPRMRALAVATAQRVPQLPDVPTFAELGFKGMEMSNWFGIVAPKGTPPAIVAKLNQAINRALKEPDMIQRITGPGNEVGGGTPAEFADFITEEARRWTKVIKDKDIRAE